MGTSLVAFSHAVAFQMHSFDALVALVLNTTTSPHLTVGRIGWILPWILRGALIAGLYGVLHDQLTYSISAEYFSDFKFYQFSYLDVGLPRACSSRWWGSRRLGR